MKQVTRTVETRGRGIYNITAEVADFVQRTEISQGLCHVFLQHTSASLIITENADPAVHRDLERWISASVPDGDPMFAHTMEGPDDMPAHIRSVLCGYDLTVPVQHGELALGTWQGIYLWEHRTSAHHRRIIVSVY